MRPPVLSRADWAEVRFWVVLLGAAFAVLHAVDRVLL